jgi:hypothetical protein
MSMSDSGSNQPDSQGDAAAAGQSAQSSSQSPSDGSALTVLEQQVLQAMRSSERTPVAVAEHPTLNKGLGPFTVSDSNPPTGTDHDQTAEESAVAGRS